MVYIGIVFSFMLNIMLGMVFYKYMLSGCESNSIDVGRSDEELTEQVLKALSVRAHLASKNPSLKVRALENRQIIASLTEIGANQEAELQSVRIAMQEKKVDQVRYLNIVN